MGFKIGSYEINKLDEDYFLVSNNTYGRSIKICGGDLESIFGIAFIDTNHVPFVKHKCSESHGCGAKYSKPLFNSTCVKCGFVGVK